MAEDPNIMTIKIDITKGEIIWPKGTEVERVGPEEVEDMYKKGFKYVGLILHSTSNPEYCIWINMGGWWIRRCFPPA